MNNALLVIIGSGLGGVLRYWLTLTSDTFLGKSFPYGTLTVNIIGSFFMGLLATIIFGQPEQQQGPLRYLLLVGLMGGFTTFSAFSLENMQLLQEKTLIPFFLNIFLSVGLCLLFVMLGNLIGKIYISH